MLGEETTRRVLVPRRDRVDEGPMLERDLVERAQDALVQAQERTEGGDVSNEHLVDTGIPAETTQRLVEGQVRPRERGDIPRPRGVFDVVGERTQGRDGRGVV